MSLLLWLCFDRVCICILYFQLAEQEEELRKEEEAYFEAKREANRIAKLQRAKDQAAKKNATTDGSRSWLGEDQEWEV